MMLERCSLDISVTRPSGDVRDNRQMVMRLYIYQNASRLLRVKNPKPTNSASTMYGTKTGSRCVQTRSQPIQTVITTFLLPIAIPTCPRVTTTLQLTSVINYVYHLGGFLHVACDWSFTSYRHWLTGRGCTSRLSASGAAAICSGSSKYSIAGGQSNPTCCCCPGNYLCFSVACWISCSSWLRSGTCMSVTRLYSIVVYSATPTRFRPLI